MSFLIAAGVDALPYVTEEYLILLMRGFPGFLFFSAFMHLVIFIGEVLQKTPAGST